MSKSLRASYYVRRLGIHAECIVPWRQSAAIIAPAFAGAALPILGLKTLSPRSMARPEMAQ
jgi:hypothetical protein